LSPALAVEGQFSWRWTTQRFEGKGCAHCRDVIEKELTESKPKSRQGKLLAETAEGKPKALAFSTRWKGSAAEGVIKLRAAPAKVTSLGLQLTQAEVAQR
jgi:hypothetical protein